MHAFKVLLWGWYDHIDDNKDRDSSKTFDNESKENAKEVQDIKLTLTVKLKTKSVIWNFFCIKW